MKKKCDYFPACFLSHLRQIATCQVSDGNSAGQTKHRPSWHMGMPLPQTLQATSSMQSPPQSTKHKQCMWPSPAHCYDAAFTSLQLNSGLYERHSKHSTFLLGKAKNLFILNLCLPSQSGLQVSPNSRACQPILFPRTHSTPSSISFL